MWLKFPLRRYKGHCPHLVPFLLTLEAVPLRAVGRSGAVNEPSWFNKPGLMHKTR